MFPEWGGWGYHYVVCTLYTVQYVKRRFLVNPGINGPANKYDRKWFKKKYLKFLPNSINCV